MRLRQVFMELNKQYNNENEFDKLLILISKKYWLGIARMGFLEEINLKDLKF